MYQKFLQLVFVLSRQVLFEFAFALEEFVAEGTLFKHAIRFRLLVILKQNWWRLFCPPYYTYNKIFFNGKMCVHLFWNVGGVISFPHLDEMKDVVLFVIESEVAVGTLEVKLTANLKAINQI